jgi:hypothetical protein
MLVHDMQALRRNIKFIENVDIHVDVCASTHCCWNCLWSVMTYEDLWCEKEMEEIDFRDLCSSWEGERTFL